MQASDTVPVLPDQSLVRVAVDRIAPAPEGQARRDFDPGRLQALAESLKRSGVREPLIVTPHGAEPGHFQIVAGERRWRAAQLAGLAEIPCIVDEQLADRKDKLLAQAEENLHRENLNAVEEAAVLAQLMEARGIHASEAGELIGKSNRQARRLYQLHQAPEPIKNAVVAGQLDARAALEMVRIFNKLAGRGESPTGASALKRIDSLIKRFIREEWSIRKLEKYASRVAERDELDAGGPTDQVPGRASKPIGEGAAKARHWKHPASVHARRQLVVEKDGFIRIDRRRIERRQLGPAERESLAVLLEKLLAAVRRV